MRQLAGQKILRGFAAVCLEVMKKDISPKKGYFVVKKGQKRSFLGEKNKARSKMTKKFKKRLAILKKLWYYSQAVTQQ